MSFDVTQPTDTTKIRNLGTVIRPNWAAIEQADSSFEPYAINYLDRTAAAIVPVTPANIATSYIQFCKQDVSGNTEMFVEDVSGNVTQMTQGTPTNSQNGSTFLPGVAATGCILFAWNRQSVANGGMVTVSALTTIYNVTVTIEDASGAPTERVYIKSKAGNKFVITTASGNAAVIYWQAIGV